MLKLLKKEFTLSMHPITLVMILLSAMVLIPNYPYTVIFFYVTMAIFFTCQLGRENNDIVYSLNLPISKRSIVKARLMFAVIIEVIQLIVMIPFAILRQKLNPMPNQAGMDANISLFAIAFIVYGLFNLVFFLSYYKNIAKVGISFIKASTVIFIYVIIDIVATYAVPFVKNFLDTKDPDFLSYKLIFLAVCIIIYAALNSFTYVRSVKNFEKQDLN